MILPISHNFNSWLDALTSSHTLREYLMYGIRGFSGALGAFKLLPPLYSIYSIQITNPKNINKRIGFYRRKFGAQFLRIKLRMAVRIHDERILISGIFLYLIIN